MSAKLVHQGQELTLLPQGAVWHEAEACLFVADLHLGKTGIFQAAGLALPDGADADTLALLSRLCDQHSPKTLVVLGDFFHAPSLGTETAVNRVQRWQAQYPAVQWVVVPGNHDRRVPWARWMPWATVLAEGSSYGSWQLFHHPPVMEGEGALRLCGHLHPGVALGPKRMSKVKAKCFWLRRDTLVLPAFGSFTGADPVAREAGDRLWVVSGEKVLLLPS
jgi:uncharacterized protein